MIGTIQQANKSKSGKTLSIQVEGTWYTTKNWELEQSINRRIIFDPSTQNFPDGASIQWLNDYVFEDQSNTPASQAMDKAMEGTSQTHIVPRVVPNKEYLIGALALTKSITGPKEQVWESFVYFYHKMENFDPNA